MDRWRTYQEAADLLGSTADAVRVRARRHGWRRHNSNDGRVRVLVPTDEEPRPTPEQQGEQGTRTSGRSPPERSPEQSGQGERPAELRLVLELLRDHAAEHRRERERAEAREDALRSEVARLAGRVAETEAAAIEGWRTAAALAQRLAASRLTGLTSGADSAPPRPGRGWLRRWLG